MRVCVVAVFAAASAFAQRGGVSAPLNSLKTVQVPVVAGLDRYVQDQTTLVALGKALFWDAQAGSDGRTACATCHFHAGADHRLQNQLTSGSAVANQVMSAADFPFRLLANPANRGSEVLRDNRMIGGSAGVVERFFLNVVEGQAQEDGLEVAHSGRFAIGGVGTRQVTTRNTPSVINAVFYPRNFWDGRASPVFTGATPFGDSDTGANVWAWLDGALVQERVRLENASLASQAAGPVLNEVEMSWAGRPWPKVARKLLSLGPLGRQKVAADDSVLGEMANPDGNGLKAEYSYARLIRQAFREEYWSAPRRDAAYEQMELNFALFWALAIQAYESTLISDDAPLDRFFAGDGNALTAEQRQGLNEFQGGGRCARCHGGPELSAAAYTSVLRRNLNGDPTNAGFFRIGVSPIPEDIGLGALDGFGVPLFTPGRVGAANGTFKAPSLRNVELTGPYFHNGSQSTLEQVLEFYGRNGDITEGGNLGPGIGAIRMSAQDRAQVVAFLKALTDERVRYQRAPFDHPSLCVPHGHVELAPGELQADGQQPGLIALDKGFLVPAVGRGGSDVPLATFEELLRGASQAPESCTP